jgi:hypothetical protein
MCAASDNDLAVDWCTACRYYGSSIPVPLSEDNTLSAADFKWLTIQQVIEDTAAVLRHVRAERSIPAAVPAVVVGGSYGKSTSAE